MTYEEALEKVMTAMGKWPGEPDGPVLDIDANFVVEHVIPWVLNQGLRPELGIMYDGRWRVTISRGMYQHGAAEVDTLHEAVIMAVAEAQP